MRLLSCEEMKQVEQYTSKFGLSYQRMMENAGAACTRNIRSIIERESSMKKSVVVVCGKGNNGGDGFVIARKLSENGYNVCIVLATGYPSSEEAVYMYKMAVDLSISTVWYDADKQKAVSTIRNTEVIIDAVFGFSFYGAVKTDLFELFSAMNNATGIKFSVDIPSGVYCNSGYCDPNCFIADYTIAISSLKPAHIIHPACDCCGDIIVASIGIPEESFKFVNNSMFTLSKTEVGHLLPARKAVSHKGDFGHLLSICGSRRMPGAAYLAAKAALRSGVGLVTAAFPKSIYSIMANKLNEALLWPLDENENGSLSKNAIPELLENLDKYSAIVIGCGLTQDEGIKEIVEAVIKNSKVPVIIDADAINVISDNLEILKEASCPLILTPHPKEMSRLIKMPTDIIQSDRIKWAKETADAENVCLVLKGSNTVVAHFENPRVYINASGNSGLSKGGSGDVLAGIIGAFCAQGMNTERAATSAVYIHGHCADLASDRLSQMGMLPTDVIDELARVFGDFER